LVIEVVKSRIKRLHLDSARCDILKWSQFERSREQTALKVNLNNFTI